MFIASRDEEELDEEQHGDDVGQHRNVLGFAGEYLNDGVGNEAETDAVADGAGDRHADEHDRGGQTLRHIIEVDFLQAAEHQQTDVDQRGGGRSGGDYRGDGRDEHAGEEQHTGGQCGQASAAAGLDAGSGLDEGGDGGGAGQCAGDGADGVGQKGFLHLGHVAVLVDHARTGRGADEGADGVEHVDHAEGDDESGHGEPADLGQTSEAELEEGGLRHVAESGKERSGGEACEGVDAEEDRFACPVDAGGCEHTQQDGALDLVVREDDDDEQADEHSHNGQHHGAVTAAHVGLGEARSERAEEVAHDVERAAGLGVDAGVGADADVQQHQADGRGDAETDAEGDSVDDLVADIENGENDEYDAFNEDDAERGLEGFEVAHAGDGNDVCHNDGEEAVESHAGRHCEGLVRGESHDEHADCGSDAGGEEHAVPELRAALRAEAGEQVGVERDDVGHRHKGGESGHKFCTDRAAVFLELEQFLH